MYFSGGRNTPQAFHLRCCIILNQAFRGGLEEQRPTRNSFFVEQASCLFLRMLQDVSFIQLDCKI
ncbi:hypothetical protein AVDCRST_MAG84-6997 [uncultured Microcoleus sp.]|uniref:Uncharacterized protein n=1 Tax=uncultured Microcoleus sp. TaxID=259945 RepID=A0A6J4PJZ2_9CYAN|nr:hypothetical protein AVDCRST_MAG84-6997 [uncultured Microcoleus sp.]